MVDSPSDRTNPDGPGGGIRERFMTLVERGRRAIGPGRTAPDAARRGVNDRSRDDGSSPDTGGHELPEKERARLTDEERVVRHLQHAEQMGQSDLVDRTGWSKAKVSRVLSAMEEEGTVCRTRVGREKIVTLPESQFDAAARESRRQVTGERE